MKETKKNNLIFYGIIFLFLIVLCFLFPYSHDDWAWGSSIGMERLNSYFYNYNGRWAGNLLVMLLTRNYILRNIVVAGTLLLIIYFVNKLNKFENKTVRLLPVLFLACIPHLILRQAVVWTSGFTNYVFPVLLILLFCYFNRDIFYDKEKPNNNVLLIIINLVLGFISTLCVEHVTIYCVILGLFVFVYRLFKFKKVSPHNIAYIIGSILGTVLMFSNEAYHSIANNIDGYRTISPITNAINNYFDVIYKELCFNNYLLNILLSLILVVLLFKTIEKTNKGKLFKYLNMLVLIAYPLYSLATKLLGVSIFLSYTKYMNGFLTIIYLLSIFASIIICIKDRKKLFIVLFNYFSIALLTGPLFIVTPIGSRCFFPMYILFIVVVCHLMSYYFDNYNNKFSFNNINIVIIIISVVIYTIYLFIYGYTFKISNDRDKYLKEHKDDIVVILPKTPYNNFVWFLNPSNEDFTERYKAFNGIDPSVQLKFVSLKEWKKVK